VLLGEIVSGNARRIPRGVAWRFRERVWTWDETNRRINRAAAALKGLGLEFQDRVVIVANNSVRLLELVFALSKTGIVAVPMAPRAVWREIEFVLEDVEAKALFVDASLDRALEGAPADVRTRVMLVGMGTGHSLPLDFDTLLEAGSEEEADFRFSEDAMRTIRFTSGTTGTPKGCIGTHRTMMASMFADLAFCPPIEAGEVGMMPLSVATGLGLNTLGCFALKGVETVMVDRFDPAAVLDLIVRHRVTRISGVPTMIAMLNEEMRARPRDISSLRMFGYSSAPIAISTIRDGLALLGCDFFQGYGSTETGGRITYLSPEDHRHFAAQNGSAGVEDAWGRNVISAGRELPGYDIRLVDEQLQQVPEGGVGEVMVRGDSTFAGYWKKPEQTRQVMRDGWLLTGDLARRSSDGYYYIVDRKRDMIVSGGYNVYSVEVETVLLTHEDVVDAAVFGVPHPTWGEAVWAAVTPRPGRRPSPEALDAHCRRNLSSFKCPKRIVLVDAMPRTSTGKVRKVELREQYRSAALASE
jgi:acyl-CoA synthetase (AMP-forming)/AMP-acid ligase II